MSAARDARRYVIHLPGNIAFDISHKRGTKTLHKVGGKDEYTIGYDKDVTHLAMVVGCQEHELETFIGSKDLHAITFENMKKVLDDHEWYQI